MAFERIYTSKKGHKYRALVEPYRDKLGRPRQRVVKWLGPVGGYRRRGKLPFAARTTSGDIGGGIVLGLPFRIVYDLVSGQRLERMKERMAHPAFGKITAGDPRGWRRPSLEAVLTQSKQVALASWAREMSRVRPPYEIARNEEERRAIKEFSARLKETQRTPAAPEARYSTLRAENVRQWQNYNATISAHFERVDAANISYAKEEGLTSQQYGVAPDSGASSQPSPDSQEPTPDASPEDAPGSSEPE